VTVPISASELAKRSPLLYHMAADGSWDSISRKGLLSTSALLDLYGYSGADRTSIEESWRPESVTIHHPDLGVAVIRDQKPMSDGGLRRCLDGMTPAAWYEELNRRVFFWLTEERLARMLNARAYRGDTHLVLVVDAATLLQRHERKVMLSPINSGATKPYPQPRGRTTFQRMDDYPFESWLAKRRGDDPIVELAVDEGVPDIADMVVRLERRRGDQLVETLQ
jgi:hypothetical protein